MSHKMAALKIFCEITQKSSFNIQYKICADSIAHPLTLIFQNSRTAGIFANDWKKANIVPIHKKMINKSFQIIDQFLFYRYVVKSLKS